MNMQDFLGKQFVRLERGRWFSAFIQFILVVYLAIETKINTSVYLLCALPVGILFAMWVYGYADEKRGFFRQQMNYYAQITPWNEEMMAGLKRIEGMLKNGPD